MSIVTLEEFKARLGVTEDTDDAMLTDILEEAQTFVEGWLGYPIDPDNHPKDLRFAVSAQAAHMFENREATIVGVSVTEAPLSVQDIIANRRNYWGVSNGE